MTDEITYVAKFIDGPFTGRNSLCIKGLPPEEVVAFEMEFFIQGSIAVKPLDESPDFLTGDHIYRKVSQSQLYDIPGALPAKGVMPGAAYKYVRSPEPTPDYSSN